METSHSTFTEKGIEHFKWRCDELFKSEKLFVTDFHIRNEKTSKTTYKVSYLTMLAEEVHTIAERLTKGLQLTMLIACRMKSIEKSWQCHFPMTQ